MSPELSCPGRVRRSFISLVPGLLLAAVRVAAQHPPTASYTRDVPADLARHATITEDSARALAAMRVPHGTLKALELEREDGHLLYSMEFTLPGESGVEEVNLDAVTGALIGREHESSGREPGDTTAQPGRPGRGGS